VGSYRGQINGLGTTCPLLAANAFGNQYMWLDGGSCGAGVLDLPIRSSTGQDAYFMLVAVALAPANQAARLPAGIVVPLGQP
jgi:hypothetical protein